MFMLGDHALEKFSGSDAAQAFEAQIRRRQDRRGSARRARGRGHCSWDRPTGGTQVFTTMSLVTDFAPRTSWASLVTRAFSAADAALPVTRTTPSVVVTLVLSARVDLWLSSAYFTWLVIDA